MPYDDEDRPGLFQMNTKRLAMPEPTREQQIRWGRAYLRSVNVVEIDEEVRLYGAEAVEHGLVIWATEPRLIYFGLPGVPLGMRVALLPVDRAVLYGDAAGRQPIYAKLANELRYVTRDS